MPPGSLARIFFSSLVSFFSASFSFLLACSALFNTESAMNMLNTVMTPLVCIAL